MTATLCASKDLQILAYSPEKLGTACICSPTFLSFSNGLNETKNGPEVRDYILVLISAFEMSIIHHTAKG